MTKSRPPRSRPPAVVHDLTATIGDRRARGPAARKRAKRGGLGHWDERDRGHDALGTILAQNKIRVPELVPLRHYRMAVSPWNYYRGAAAVMAGDLASQPDSGLIVQLCGDAHVLNFGLWATPERNLSFDLRDFDETLPGPFEWDVKRFAASLVVAARENGIRPKAANAAVAAGVEAYCRRIRLYRTMPELDTWYDNMHVDSLIGYFEPADRGRVSIHIEKKRKRRTSRGAFAKLTTMVHGRPRITEEPRFGSRSATPSRRPHRSPAGRVPADPAGGPAEPVRPVHGGRRGASGGRGRQRRDAGLPGPARGPHRRRPAVPSGQAGRPGRVRGAHAAAATTITARG